MENKNSDNASIKIVIKMLKKLNNSSNKPASSLTSSSSDDLEYLLGTFRSNNKEEEAGIKVNATMYDIIHESELSKSQSSNTTMPTTSTSAQSSATSKSQSVKEEPSGILNYLWSKFFNSKSPAQETVSIASFPSLNSAYEGQSVDEVTLQEVRRQIRDLEKQGPVGLAHIGALSNIINRRILVWSSSATLRHDIGKNRPGQPLNVQFHSQPGQVHGHWTILGNEDLEYIETELNNCLFDAIAAQTGHKPSELRQGTVECMKKYMKSVAKIIKNLSQQQNGDKVVIMLGGAKYTGKSATHAQSVIDNSQHGRSHPDHRQGHPRGHASHSTATGRTESAENYSQGGWKTAFLSRADQDAVGHLALSTTSAQGAMQSLNHGAVRQVVRVSVSEIRESLPQGAHFNNGQRGNIEDIRQLVLVLEHYAGHHRDPDHDVFVHTFYPVLR